MSQPRLKDKIAIVSGAGSRGPMPGTGQATAILFAREGAKLLLADRDIDRAQETQAAIQAEGGRAEVVAADVTREDACKNIIDACLEHYGALHILFNNVGGYGGGMVTEIDAPALEASLAVNLHSALYMSKYAIPAMIASGGGSIINVSSIDAARAGFSRNIPYSVAKAGIEQLTRASAVHHGRDNIRVNCIAPGHLHGPFVQHISDEMRERRRKAGPLGSEGNAWDVAWAAVFFASDESRWITGAILPIDAGARVASALSVYDNLR